MLTLADVSKSYGTRTLFSDVSLFVSRTDRYGLVEQQQRRLGYEQPGEVGAHHPAAGKRLRDLVGVALLEAEAGEETILQLALGHTPAHNVDAAHDHFYDEREPQAKKILAGLGFRERDFDTPAKTFSGGWVMRAHLARLLVAEPALLLLDEPTNHLDLHALLWLQDYLTRYPGGLLLISHDRAFLNALCTGILELRGATLNRYTGSYDDYLRQKDERHAQQLAAYKNQQREIAHLQRFVDRFGAKASLASRAKSKEKQIERLQEEAVEAPEQDLKRINFRFPQPPRSGLRVVTLEHVEQAYGEHVVYRDLNFETERGQRIVLVGPNGAGKSTLLKILAGVVPIRGGTLELGSNVTPGYFAQNRTDTLRPQATVLDNVMELRTAQNDLTEQQARTILGAFLFRKDDVFKKVAVLSGGEKSRLALARLLVNPPNLLLMDEPTTHLDIPSIDALITALQQYEGTLVFISHDVYFIRQVAKHVLHINAGRLTAYAGDYDYYLDKSRATDARAATVAAGFTDARPGQETPNSKPQTPNSSAQRSGPKTKEQKRAEAEARAARSAPLRAARARVRHLEEEISKLEQQQAELTAALEAPETYNTPGKAQQLNRELSAAIDRLQAATEDWERTANEVAELER